MQPDKDIYVFHWQSENYQWKKVFWDDWIKFHGTSGPSRSLPGVSGGIHHFVVCVLDENDALVNLIPHKYLVNLDGSKGRDNFSGLTQDERAAYSNIMLSPTARLSDRFVLADIRAKMGKANDPPLHSIYALICAIQKIPVRDSAADIFLRDMCQV